MLCVHTKPETKSANLTVLDLLFDKGIALPIYMNGTGVDFLHEILYLIW